MSKQSTCDDEEVRDILQNIDFEDDFHSSSSETYSWFKFQLDTLVWNDAYLNILITKDK